MRRTRPLLAASVALATTLSTERPALAQDAPDVGELAGFVRWGGVLLSLFVIGGIIVFLRVTGTLANSLSNSSRRVARRFRRWNRSSASGPTWSTPSSASGSASALIRRR